MEKETIIISLGGSLIVPDGVDTNFLKEFKELILSHIENGKKFIIVTGGGKVARVYQDAAKNLSKPQSEDLDWIGISALRLNGELVRVIFEDKAHSEVICNLSEDFPTTKPVIIGAAYRPGHSTDWDAVLAAKKVGAKRIINLSNIDHVYDSDPRHNPNAKKFEHLSWAEYLNLIPRDWKPGLSTPFDPTASTDAMVAGLEVVIMNGKPIDNLANYLNSEKFLGTVIS